MERKKLRYGQIGGTMNAFIGAVHRKAIAINEQAELVAGCFSSSNQEANRTCGEHYGISPERIYTNYKDMIKAEAERKEDRLDFIVICTPNNTHYDIAKACMEQGFHIACEKPLCFTIAEAEELKQMAEDRGLFFCVTYTYTGYNMVKQAREMIADGVIGELIDVKAEYLQNWLMDEVSEGKDVSGKSPIWRLNPETSGISCSVGDIGTHIEDTVTYIIGTRVKKVAAMLDRYNHRLDLNANMLVEFENGVHGSFCCSQVAAGHYNGFVIRVFGTKGAIEWEQEHPDFLKVTLKDKPIQIYTRAAFGTPHALELNRIPAGHPEGLIMAFANIYKVFAQAILNKLNGIPNDGKWSLDFPTVDDGLWGVRFINACVKSSEQGAAWIEI